jgi:hypothetical protein
LAVPRTDVSAAFPVVERREMKPALGPASAFLGLIRQGSEAYKPGLARIFDLWVGRVATAAVGAREVPAL